MKPSPMVKTLIHALLGWSLERSALGGFPTGKMAVA